MKKNKQSKNKLLSTLTEKRRKEIPAAFELNGESELIGDVTFAGLIDKGMEEKGEISLKKVRRKLRQ